MLFTDIKNFSTLAEQIDAEPLMRWLNEYMEEMAEVVLHHEGAIDKFIGDSVMAVFAGRCYGRRSRRLPGMRSRRYAVLWIWRRPCAS